MLFRDQVFHCVMPYAGFCGSLSRLDRLQTCLESLQKLLQIFQASPYPSIWQPQYTKLLEVWLETEKFTTQEQTSQMQVPGLLYFQVKTTKVRLKTVSLESRLKNTNLLFIGQLHQGIFGLRLIVTKRFYTWQLGKTLL